MYSDVSDCCGADVYFSKDGLGNEFYYCEECDHCCSPIDVDKFVKESEEDD
jgi:hypothetical protein